MQKLLYGVLLLLYSIKGFSCDVCGSAGAGSQLGILPQFQKHFVGIRYQYSGFNSKSHHNPAETTAQSREQFHTTQLWGRVVLHQRVHLYAFLPYKTNIRQTEAEQILVRGLGDAMVMANMILLNPSLKSERTLRHSMQIGLGIKLPSGKSNTLRNGLMLHPNIQTGTGSIDIPINLIYTLRYKALGAQAEVNYTYNNFNAQNFKFGNRNLSTLRFFLWKNINNFSLLPNLGTTYESGARDVQNKTLQDYTGGDCLAGNVGLDVYYKQFAFNLLFQKYLYQNMGNGLIANHPRFSLNFLYLFKPTKK